MLRTAALLLMAAFALPAAAGAQAQPGPSLTHDTFFAATSGGIADGDFSATNIIPDVAAGVAVHGDRIYTVGRTGSSISADIGIMARRPDGNFDTGFSEDGKLVVPVAAGSDEDDGRGIVVLPDGRIRILGTTRASTNKDIVILGLEPDGDPDRTFGTADGRGNRTVVLTGAGEDTAGGIALAPDGRLAIAGSRRVGTSDDLLVALRNGDGSPAAGFGTGGVRIVNLGGGAVDDGGVDVAFRPGGGLAVLSALETPDRAVLYAVDGLGDADPAFGTGGQLTVDPGGSSTTAGGLLAYGGAFYVAGSTTIGTDLDAFVARVDAAGAAVQSRRFDVRGRLVGSGQAATTHAADLAVAAGPPATLIAVGTVRYSNDFGTQFTDWAVAAFNGFEDDITQAGYGDLVIPAPGEGGLAAVAAGGAGWLAVAGRHVLNADDGFGNARVLLDADKACDLSLTVADPAEIVFRAAAPASLPVRVTNLGTRPCAGTVTVPAPYRMTPLDTGVLSPGATFAASGPIAYDGPRRGEDILLVTLAATGDANANNDQTAAHVVFSFCDLGVQSVGGGRSVPSEGTWGFPILLRNSGTIACRVGIGSKPRYSLAGGVTVADRVRAAAPRGAQPGTRAPVRLQANAEDDVNAANDAATIRPRVVGVGDSDVRGQGAQGFSGTASGGSGKLKAGRLRPARVEVALLRKGATGCSWLRSSSGAFEAGKPRAGGGCAGRQWVRADGTRHWRLRLGRQLPAGRYVAFSRTTIQAGFREARFSSADRNRVEFRIG